MGDCIIALNEIQKNLRRMATSKSQNQCVSSRENGKIVQRLAVAPGLSTEEKQDLGEYILGIIARSSDQVLGKDHRSKLYADIQLMGIRASSTLYPQYT